jgi:hypothetical protein
MAPVRAPSRCSRPRPASDLPSSGSMPLTARGSSEASQSDREAVASRARDEAEASGPLDAWLDRALEGTFPASDPISSPPKSLARTDLDRDL